DHTTRRDLSGWAAFMIALIIFIIAFVVGLLIQTPLLWTAIPAVSAILFSGFLVFELNTTCPVWTLG
ncbi:MAG TPA: hypothetical protein VLU92_12140, partial [Candidatus Dormibacteraeota bacterium]|nr:hypothetical protein [Candidatus Dormibacteraeota bacterium]